jgi:hypothetical protein
LIDATAGVHCGTRCGLKTAKALGLTIETLLATADEVIQ